MGKTKKEEERNARKGESWPLGPDEAVSLSEGAGDSTKWLIHSPRDPLLQPQLRKYTHTHCGWRSGNPGAGLCRDGNTASVNPEGALARVKGHGWILPLSVHECIWLWRPQASVEKIWPPLGLVWPLLVFFNFLTTEETNGKKGLNFRKKEV